MLISILPVWAVASYSTPCLAGDRFPGKTFGLSAVAGVPQFIGLELSYLNFSSFIFGMSFGSAPINGILNSRISLTPVPVQFSLPDTYNLYPTASYSMYSASVFVKFFPWKGGFFFDFTLSNVSFNTSVQGNLKDETTGGVFNSALSGSASLSQFILGLSAGYQVSIKSSVFLEFAVGAGYLLSPAYSISLGGTAAAAVGVVPNGEQAFSSAKSQVQAMYDSAINTYRSALSVIPMSYLNLGITF